MTNPRPQVGPELGPEVWDGEHATQFIEHYLDGANHADGKAPDYASFHYPAGALCGAPPVRVRQVSATFFFVSAALNWMCVGTRRRRVLPSSVCA